MAAMERKLDELLAKANAANSREAGWERRARCITSLQPFNG